MAPVDQTPSLTLDSSSVVVITGCSRGLGLGLAQGFLEGTQCSVVATARNLAKAAGLQELHSKYPERLKLESLDTENEDSIKAAAAAVGKIHKGIDLLFNNAGIDEGVDKSCLDLTGQEYEKILKVNVVGYFLTTKAFLPLLRNKQSRVIVNMSSALGSIARNKLGITEPAKNPVGNKWIAYNASKSAVNMQTSVFANELKDDGFCVVALSPGWVNTDMGGDNARKLGMKGAPLSLEESIALQLKVVKGLSRKDNGSFVDEKGDSIDY